MACEKTAVRAPIERALRAAGCVCVPFMPSGANGLDEWPDSLVLGPHGVCVFVEYKAPGKKPRPGQKKTLDLLRAMGYNTMVIDRPRQFAWLAHALGLEPREPANAA